MTQSDPGNSQPEDWTGDLSDDEANDAYGAIEASLEDYLSDETEASA